MKPRRVLIIGDLHSPFILDGYLDHCLSIYKKHKCNTVVFIGDIIDNHFASYHETDPDGWGGKDELDLAIKRIQPWAKAFPKAKVCTGNHDALVQRKAFSSKIPATWIKPFNEVLGTPGWKWGQSHIIDKVLYTHGTNGKASKRVVGNMQSTVCGHYHTEASIFFHANHSVRLFSMQVGCGIDHESYAMAYAKEGKKPIISCGVVLEGITPIIEPMLLGKECPKD